MRIRFTKSRQGPVLTCTRDDGSIAGMKDRKHGAFFVRHDFVHYAVETVLGFRTAFWGLVAGLDGQHAWSFEDFTEKGVAKRLPREALIAETLVSLIDQAALFAEAPLSAADINRDLRASLKGDASDSVPDVSQSQLDAIVARMTLMQANYRELPEGGFLELEFPSDTGQPIAVRDGHRETAAQGKSIRPRAPH